MKKSTRKVTAGYQKIILFGVSLLTGTGILFIAKTTTQRMSGGMPAVQPISYPYVPLHPEKPAPDNAREKAAIQAFQKWLDSLQHDRVGKRLYDSLCRTRPGLLDSAAEAARYYNLQNLIK